MTCIGIDPGYDRLGWAVGEVSTTGLKIVAYDCIQPPKNVDVWQRYAALESQLSQVLEKYAPTKAGIESLFFSKNQTTAMKVAEARGVILSSLVRHQVAITEFNPMQIKQQVTGNGRADKKAMAKMIELEYQLPAKTLDDTIDAIGCLMTLRWHLGRVRWST
jgi:crossover junction endodeoxyribonuclease RuvC